MIYYEDSNIIIRTMKESDIDYFSSEFIKLGWGDRKDTFILYYREQELLERDVLVAEHNGMPAGYITLIPNAASGPFSNMNIPEIKDFNVLPQFRRLGIGNHLMNCIEDIAKQKCKQICLGVGLYSDYGTAQRMYVKRGYIPDGSGVWYNNRNLDPCESCINDDDLNLYFIKQLSE